MNKEAFWTSNSYAHDQSLTLVGTGTISLIVTAERMLAHTHLRLKGRFVSIFLLKSPKNARIVSFFHLFITKTTFRPSTVSDLFSCCKGYFL